MENVIKILMGLFTLKLVHLFIDIYLDRKFSHCNLGQILKLTVEKNHDSTITRRNLGFFHYPNPLFFNEMGQSSLICNLHGFGKKRLVH
jgi:hypothetical protein